MCNGTRDIAALVLKDMVSILNNWQLEKLRESLALAFRGVEIVAVEGISEPLAEENLNLLFSFLAAKSVEGCSERTIAYYKSTLLKALDAMAKHVSLVTTDDLRTYLHTYPQAHGASNATVDNVRRVISSFFSWLEEEDHIVKSPARRIHKIRSCKAVKQTYCDEELERLRDGCARERDLAMIDFLASTGVRVCHGRSEECAAITSKVCLLNGHCNRRLY